MTQPLACPGCGAPIKFRSAASVMAVCEFCKTTVLKDADSVRSLGKMSEVLEDYSPIQMNTSGQYQGLGFTVIGRIQLRYDAGFWNEWYVLQDDGSNAWLSDASGQYTYTRQQPTSKVLPPFERLTPGMSINVSGTPFTTSDIRTAQCTGGQGELPFKVGEGWRARVADFRSGQRFLTLDYSDGSEPATYVGEAVTLEGLRCQLLRAPDEITDSAGRYKGKLGKLDCPSCGSSVAFSPGMTTHVLCPSCHAAIDYSGPTAEVIAAANQVAQIPTSIPLGAQAKIDNATYTLLGLMRRAEDGEEGSAWMEYLLYSPERGFIWLVETDSGWQRSQVLNVWPNWNNEQALLDNVPHAKQYDYNATVTYAIGSFNWRVMVGDHTRIIDYRQGQTVLSAEMDGAELTWSRSVPVTAAQLSAWFGQKVQEPATAAPDSSYRSSARMLLIVLAIINAVPLLGSAHAWRWFLITAAAIYVPAFCLDMMEKGNEGGA